MEIQGKIKLIEETKTYGEKGFKKRDVVIATEEQYPQQILIEFIQDKCSLLDDFNINDVVNINFNLRGREWVNKQGETKYFNSVQGWRIEKVSYKANDEDLPSTPYKEEENTNDDDTDDLPF